MIVVALQTLPNSSMTCHGVAGILCVAIAMFSQANWAYFVLSLSIEASPPPF